MHFYLASNSSRESSPGRQNTMHHGFVSCDYSIVLYQCFKSNVVYFCLWRVLVKKRTCARSCLNHLRRHATKYYFDMSMQNPDCKHEKADVTGWRRVAKECVCVLSVRTRACVDMKEQQWGELNIKWHSELSSLHSRGVWERIMPGKKRVMVDCRLWWINGFPVKTKPLFLVIWFGYEEQYYTTCKLTVS